MIVSATDTLISGGIKFELDDTTLVTLIAGVLAAGSIAGDLLFVMRMTEMSHIYVDVARDIVAKARKTPKEDNP